MRFEYVLENDWPRLAWLAVLQPGSDVLVVLHGPRVETTNEWFCEAAWDGEFADGGFDKTDLVVGSGGRLRGGRAVFVPSGHTLDRLHAIQLERSKLVSNSLVCLTAILNAGVDPAYGKYGYDFRSIVNGLDGYDPELATSAGAVTLTYFDNLVWDGRSIAPVDKPFPRRDFGSYVQYRRFLDESLARVRRNSASEGRQYPYGLLGTISSGYDSAAIAVLGRSVGLRSVVSFDAHWTGNPDSGAELAQCLDLDMIPISSTAWHEVEDSVVPFLAADANGGDVAYWGAGDASAGRLLLTGYQAGRMWSKRESLPGDSRMTRTDSSGLSLTEFRLWKGFLNCPVPFFGIRQVEDVNCIGRSAEMEPWDVGGSYNKPIPRRILEEAGVPRGMFARTKIGVSVQISSPDLFRKASIRRAYREWLHSQAATWVRSGRLPPQIVSTMAYPLQGAAGVASRGLRGLESEIGLSHRVSQVLRRFATRDYAFKFVFPWALSRATERYPVDEEVLRLVA